MITFPGIYAVRRADFTMNHGSRADAVRIVALNLDNMGLLPNTLSWDGWSMAQCVPDLSTVQLHRFPDRNGERAWSILIYDRRKKWEKTTISGRYNVRCRDGTVDPDTKKTLEELATLLFDETGETGYSLDNVPAGAFPYVDWAGTSVSDAFDQIFGDLQTDTILKLSDDTASVVKLGEGAGLINPTQAYNPNLYFDRPIPAAVKVIGGPTWYHGLWELEAVGWEADGEIKLLDDLSYAPINGWGNEWPTLWSGVEQSKRHLAFECAFRAFRVKGPLALPGGDSVSDASQIILDDMKLSDCTNGIRAELLGTYYPWTDHYENTSDCTHYPGEWWLDRRRNLIITKTPVIKKGGVGCFEQPTLYIETGCRARRDDTNDFFRHEKTMGMAGTAPEDVIVRDELFAAYVQTGSQCPLSGTVSDNLTELNAEMDVYLNRRKAFFESNRIRDLEYPGFRVIDLTGKIRQVEYSDSVNEPGAYVRGYENYSGSIYSRRR